MPSASSGGTAWLSSRRQSSPRARAPAAFPRAGVSAPGAPSLLRWLSRKAPPGSSRCWSAPRRPANDLTGDPRACRRSRAAAGRAPPDGPQGRASRADACHTPPSAPGRARIRAAEALVLSPRRHCAGDDFAGVLERGLVVPLRGREPPRNLRQRIGQGLRVELLHQPVMLTPGLFEVATARRSAVDDRLSRRGRCRRLRRGSTGRRPPRPARHRTDEGAASARGSAERISVPQKVAYLRLFRFRRLAAHPDSAGGRAPALCQRCLEDASELPCGQPVPPTESGWRC